MIRKLQKSKLLKFFAVFMLLNFLNEIVNPLRIFALTSGPEQPEMQGFTPVDTSNLVNISTGDFHYSIPLMTVPGPNGEYPIVLNYNAGIGVEQEASWVGLGWSLNPGAITREMRGIPDDFSGETITQNTNIKKNITIDAGAQLGDIEALGFSIDNLVNLSAGGGISYNTYSGLGLNFDINLSTSEKAWQNGSVNLGLSWANGKGFDISPSISLSSIQAGKFKDMKEGTSLGAGLGMNFNSHEGLTSVNLSSSLNNKYQRAVEGKNMQCSRSTGAGCSFVKSSFLPQIIHPMSGFTCNGKVKVGIAAAVTTSLDIYFRYTQNKLKEKTISTPAYGTLYLQNSKDDALLDYNMEKEGIINKNTTNIGVPVMTKDIYNINGEQMSGDFNLFRNDMGGFHPSITENTSNDVGLGTDLASTGACNHLGVNVDIKHTESYSGKWKDGLSSFNNKYVYVFNYADSVHPNNLLYESSYFRSSGDMSASETNQLSHIYGDAVVRNTTEQAGQDTYTSGNLATNSTNNAIPINNSVNQSRKRRTMGVQYHTYSEASVLGNTSGSTNNFVSQIHDFTVTKENGTQYEYGYPLLNKEYKEVYYNTNKDFGQSGQQFKRIPYDGTDASLDNKAGIDHFYNSKEIPNYVHSYLLTAIKSVDYVDINANNVVDDADLGYWVKFGYGVNTADKIYYHWRFPYKDANFSPGFLSNPKDNKANYTYGVKEMTYAKTIETKTHKAIFYISPRNDGLGAKDESGSGIGTDNLYRLDSIQLVSKLDPSGIPIKTAHFTYNYSLCQETENSNSTLPANGGNKGKLTLKEVYFTYGKNKKGKYSPYKFTYKNTYGNSNTPMNWGEQNYDRWGNYYPESSISNPYTPQNNSNIDEWAAAWCLTKIDLPSGASINITYESDDYAYVQNKPAMQMFKIKRLGDNSQSDCTKDNLKVYFDLAMGANGQYISDANYYLSGLRDNLVFFKAFMELTNNDYDYIEGYATIDPTTFIADNVAGEGSIRFNPIDYGSGRSTHPFRMAGWQYLRMYRTDLLFPSTTGDEGAMQLVNIIVDLVKDIGTMLTGYYNYSYIAGRCKNLQVGNAIYPSYIRLNCPTQCKKGGGHRVKTLEVSDNWAAPAPSSYKQNYVYKTYENGRVISSGVAAYEPIIGGEENPFRHPVYYGTDRLLCRNDQLYSEEPFEESYFPAPTVCYSKVLVYNVFPNNVTKAATGITMYEYYTAKDFPLITDYTEIEKEKYKLNIPIPLVGSTNNASHSFSQGYRIILNNMHGQQKSKAVYASLADPMQLINPANNYTPTEKEEYFYKTKYPYNPNAKNELDNTVTVLFHDNDEVSKTLGESFDFFTENKESSMESGGGGVNANIDLLAIITIPTFFPNYSSVKQCDRIISTNKVIYRNGILEETVVTKNGAVVSTKNLVYDAYTGSPIKTVTTTNYNTNIAKTYNAPVYNYSFMGKWYYPEMGATYQNTRFASPSVSYVNGKYELSSANTYFVPGDKVIVYGSSSSVVGWVTQVNEDGFVVKNKDNSNISISPATIKIVNSGYKNLQNVSAGYIQSLTDPNAARRCPLLDEYNIYSNSNWKIYDDPNDYYFYFGSFTYKDCFNKEMAACFKIYNSNHNNQNGGDFYVAISCSPGRETSCNNTCYKFKTHMLNFNSFFNGSQCYIKFKKIGNKILITAKTNASMPETSEECDLIKEISCNSNCLMECLDGVLDAKAIEFSNTNWVYPYTDMDDLLHTDAGSIWNYINNSNSINKNPYSNGQAGIYRLSRENINYTNRLQTQDDLNSSAFMTNAGKDGTYDVFTIFDWMEGNADNTQANWKWTSTPTMYSPYGYDLENKNALNIFSSAMYGYSNSLPVAVSNNARYFEIGYDGFEDYIPSCTTWNHGHVVVPHSNHTLTSSTAHTGKNCLKTTAQSSVIQLGISTVASYTGLDIQNTNSLQLLKGKQYTLKVWVKPVDPYNTARKEYKINSSIDANVFSALSGNQNPVNGWLPLSFTFTVPSNGSSLTLNIYLPEEGACIDDIRIQPATGTMKSYVYDSKTLKLLAELDDNNYATFYNYDEEGTLVQVKKETERGIYTVKTTRQNIKQLLP